MNPENTDCDRTLHLLLRTFFDIIRLRKGPEDVPNSPLVLVWSFGLLLIAIFCWSALANPTAGENIVISLISSLLTYVLYAIVLASTGYYRRFTPTIASIMGCGSIITIVVVFILALLTPIAGQTFAAVLAELVLFWSVPVKGHIIARAIGRHWYVGIVIAITIFVLQFLIYAKLTGQV